MTRQVLWIAARFALVYGALTWLAAVTPVYAALERPCVRVANALLRESADETRALSLEPRDGAAVYLYELRVGSQGRRLERGMHAHGFVELLFIALVAATPWGVTRRLGWALVSGAALVFAVCVLMLMSDVAGWEAEARGAMGLAALSGRPYAIPLGFVAGLHQTAAAGLIPIAFWTLVTIRPGAPRG
ncbi:MAG TPA: hypothetical protein VMR50_01225 [Myxococcota bacterium]|nr:hypothetical protein [Myxococcota bacterium]